MANTLLGSLAMKAKKKRILARGKTGLEKGYFNMRGPLECLNADRKEPAGRERRKNWPSGKKSRLPVEGFSCITDPPT